jgi:hypothetical protein
MPKEFTNKLETEARSSKLMEEVNAILCKAFLDNLTSPASKAMLIQTGKNSMRNATAVTFARAFKAGAVPVVVGTPIFQGGYYIFNLDATPTNAGFSGNVHDVAGLFQTVDVNWIAIGERA